MKTSYVFEWLDNLITYELNAAFLHPSPMTEEAARQKIRQIGEEQQVLISELKHQFFGLKDEGNSGLLVRKLHDALVGLINKAYEQQQHEGVQAANLLTVLQAAIDSLEEVLHFIQTSYAAFLTLERPIPVTHAITLRNALATKRPDIEQKLTEAGNGQDVTHIVIGALDDLVARIDQGRMITQREAFYHQSVIRDIEDNKGQHTALSNCPSLHELLVYWNFNSKDCIRYFTLGLDNIIKSNETVKEQLDFMQFQLKNIIQLPQIPDFIYDPAYPSLKQYFTDYLSNEIEYLEKKQIGFIPNQDYEAMQSKRAIYKIICALSVDQISLILRAAHELKLIIGRSLDAVYKAIVPHLSTEQKEELSWKSMRNKATAAEDRDIEVAVDALNQIMLKIKTY